MNGSLGLRILLTGATGLVGQGVALACRSSARVYISGAGADPASRIMPLRVKGETEQVLATLPMRVVLLRPGAVRPVAGTGSGHALLKPLYWAGAPLMRLAGAAAPSLVTSNLTLGKAMIALARMDNPPLVVACGDINRIAADAGAESA